MCLRLGYSNSTISIHALRGEGDVHYPDENGPVYISIHALRGEGDIKPDHYHTSTQRFQSTPSAGRATLHKSGLL